MSSDRTTSRALFESLIDDAALFPPAKDPMDVALPGHVERRTSPHGWMLGRFLVAGTRLEDLRETLARDVSMDLGLILAAPADLDVLNVVDDDRRLSLAGIELGPKFGDSTSLAVDPSIPTYREIDRSGDLDDQLDQVSTDGVGAKLRTGGLEAGAFPSVDELASFITGCVARDLGFKCTAGLHNAIAHTDEATGFEHHGFLNILCATHAALDGEDPSQALTDRVGAGLIKTVSAITPADATAIRECFHGYGSCVFSEPVDDLVGLGLIEGSSR
ncbi:MAG: hypothetical protein GEU79_02600 [Acidimicrobiia bacterium]|nr:hypothetical protein [Acidimicrobiia bacterium]